MAGEQVQQSSIEGRGVFAARAIPEGTVIGGYPGFPRRPADMAAKVRRHPAAQAYVFDTDRGWFLDPTDARGRPPRGRLWGFADTTLAFVNEPPPGMRTNLEVRDGARNTEVLFVAAYNICAAEELLVDYGKTYDRSDYGRSRTS